MIKNRKTKHQKGKIYMDKNQIQDKVFTIVCEIFGIDPVKSNVGIEQVREQFYLDSISMIALITALERNFDIEIDDEEITDQIVSSFDAVVAFVGGKINTTGSNNG